tara:strand:- start:665 stop:1054 length:390 start_codon:yes stop_codon:yes gene_type:complete
MSITPKNPPVYNDNIEITNVRFEDDDAPSKEEIDAYCEMFPETPKWLVASTLLFLKKNPHYKATGCLGKKPPTGKDIRAAKKSSGLVSRQLPNSFIDTRYGDDEWSQDKCKEVWRANEEQFKSKFNSIE